MEPFPCVPNLNNPRRKTCIFCYPSFVSEQRNKGNELLFLHPLLLRLTPPSTIYIPSLFRPPPSSSSYTPATGVEGVLQHQAQAIKMIAEETKGNLGDITADYADDAEGVRAEHAAAAAGCKQQKDGVKVRRTRKEQSRVSYLSTMHSDVFAGELENYRWHRMTYSSQLTHVH